MNDPLVLIRLLMILVLVMADIIDLALVLQPRDVKRFVTTSIPTEMSGVMIVVIMFVIMVAIVLCHLVLIAADLAAPIHPALVPAVTVLLLMMIIPKLFKLSLALLASSLVDKARISDVLNQRPDAEYNSSAQLTLRRLIASAKYLVRVLDVLRPLPPSIESSKIVVWVLLPEPALTSPIRVVVVVVLLVLVLMSVLVPAPVLVLVLVPVLMLVGLARLPCEKAKTACKSWFLIVLLALLSAGVARLLEIFKSGAAVTSILSVNPKA